MVLFSLHTALALAGKYYQFSSGLYTDYVTKQRDFQFIDKNLHSLSFHSSDYACRHIGAALIELEDTLGQNTMVTCTGEEKGHTMRLLI